MGEFKKGFSVKKIVDTPEGTAAIFEYDMQITPENDPNGCTERLQGYVEIIKRLQQEEAEA